MFPIPPPQPAISSLPNFFIEPSAEGDLSALVEAKSHVIRLAAEGPQQSDMLPRLRRHSSHEVVGSALPHQRRIVRFSQCPTRSL